MSLLDEYELITREINQVKDILEDFYAYTDCVPHILDYRGCKVEGNLHELIKKRMGSTGVAHGIMKELLRVLKDRKSFLARQLKQLAMEITSEC